MIKLRVNIYQNYYDDSQKDRLDAPFIPYFYKEYIDSTRKQILTNITTVAFDEKNIKTISR
jgi:Fic family protein